MRIFLTIAILLTSVRAAGAGQSVTARQASCARTLPAGLIIRILPDEKIVAGKTEGPLIFTVASDVRLFPGKPPLIPRSSKLFAKVGQSSNSGRLWGRAQYRVIFDTILTPNECEYTIDAKLIEAGKYDVRKETVVGKGHARRDFFALLFPPTTIYQLIRIPARGPKLVLDEETTLAVRLLQPVHLHETMASQSRTPETLQPAQPAPEVPSPKPAAAAELVSAECPDKPQPDLRRPIQLRNSLVRPFRNMTPYYVSLVVDKNTLTSIRPCYATLVTTPVGEFKLSAKASLPDAGGQREIPLEIVVNPAGTGWDIVAPERNPELAATSSRPRQ